VRVYVAGKLRPGDPRTTPLTYHAQIVVQVGGYVPPHASLPLLAGAMRRGLALALLALALTTAGCGASSSATPPITVGAARTFQMARFQLAGAVAGRPAHLSFAVDQPSGAPLTRYRTGSGPHTGVHVIFVRSDLGAIVHRHPPVGADGTIDDEVTFPSGGRYRMVLDVYPAAGPQRNFQLFRWVDVGGKTTRARRV